jgi:hypothetical protein
VHDCQGVGRSAARRLSMLVSVSTGGLDAEVSGGELDRVGALEALGRSAGSLHPLSAGCARFAASRPRGGIARREVTAVAVMGASGRIAPMAPSPPFQRSRPPDARREQKRSNHTRYRGSSTSAFVMRVLVRWLCTGPVSRRTRARPSYPRRGSRSAGSARCSMAGYSSLPASWRARLAHPGPQCRSRCSPRCSRPRPHNRALVPKRSPLVRRFSVA